MEPELSVVLFRRIGWTDQDYWAFCHRLLADQVGFVVPTRWQGETVLRLCVVNPRTTMDDIRAVLPPAQGAPPGRPSPQERGHPG